MNFCVTDPDGGYDATDFGEDRIDAPLESPDRIPLVVMAVCMERGRLDGGDLGEGPLSR